MCERSDKWQGSKWIRKDKRRSIYMRDHGRCVYCESQAFLTLDHLMPVAKGGTNKVTNLVTACRACNLSKGTKSWREYAQKYPGAVGRIQRQRRRSIKHLRPVARAALELEQTGKALTALKSA